MATSMDAAAHPATDESSRASAIAGRTRSFSMIRWFAALSLLCISAIAVGSAIVQERFISHQVLTRDAKVTSEFLNSIVSAEALSSYFATAGAGGKVPQLESFFNHVAFMPGVMGANVFGRDGKVIWSTTQSLPGSRFNDNDELKQALTGEIIYETGTVGETSKQEHAKLRDEHLGQRFVETYVPIWNDERTAVVGAVEVYKVPVELDQSLSQGRMLIWSIAAASAVLLFISLFWIVRRADRTMYAQHQRLLEVESMAAIGETAAAVTHAIRNPLAAIRACAEMTQHGTIDDARELSKDIISEADRLNRWTRELLMFSRSEPEQALTIDLNDFVEGFVIDNEEQLNRRNIDIEWNRSDVAAPVSVPLSSISHAVGTLVTNAQEAMRDGGVITMSVEHDGKRNSARLVIVDNGPGIPVSQLERMQKPFMSTKQGGTGLGIPLARQILSRVGASLNFEPAKPHGLKVVIELPLAERRINTKLHMLSF